MSKHILTLVLSTSIIVTSMGSALAMERFQGDGREVLKGETKYFNLERNAYFGDLHVHTMNSFDAFIANVRATPDDAYRYAKGEPIRHASGFEIRLGGRALDFLAVTDHVEYLGILPAMADPNHKLSKLELSRQMVSTDRSKIRKAFLTIGYTIRDGKRLEVLDSPETIASAWDETKAAAIKHYVPGKFTTFIGYEFTSIPDGQNLHRNVIFRDEDVPASPFGAFESRNPEDLWAWMDEQRALGYESLAIPHNSNVSNGQMFMRETYEGKSFDADYATIRMRNEPLVEVSQIKGTSETHPLLSPNDEWAGFELFETLISTTIKGKVPGSYVREAYRNGLEMEDQSGFNPYKFGLIGSTDTHNGGGPIEEANYFGKIGVNDGTPQARAILPKGTSLSEEEAASNVRSNWSAAGLAGVWAEENTRASIYSALRRKETFATSGPRIRVRFFAGYDFTKGDVSNPNVIAEAYEGGVSMGGDLIADGSKAPGFLAWATRDPNSGWLQRLQIIKGWTESGKSSEAVFDIACSDGGVPDPATHRCPDNGAGVNLEDCSVSIDKGATELRTLWHDPSFKVGQRAFYYVRVLENPTCRWSDWDQARSDLVAAKKMQVTTQERAWTSPIWYSPTR